MASITGWNRLEPLPRTDDLAEALEARIADPLWLLARQWQIGEFVGEDGGSPIVARLSAEAARISRFHAGRPGDSDSGENAVDYDESSTPLEVMVERERVREPGVNLELAVEAGLHFLRLLAHHGAGALASAYREAYAFPEEPPAGAGREARDWYLLVARRALDGFALHADLIAHRGDAPALTSLPASPAIADEDEETVLAAANDWLGGYAAVVSEPADENASWTPERLEYRFAAAATLSDGPVVLHADEFSEGELDWYSLRLDAAPDLGVPSGTAASETITRTVLPTPVSYAGQPAARFWELEDGTVTFGNLSLAPGDVARVVMVEFALAYGDDWFVVPIDLPVGSVCAVRKLEITDTFGAVTLVPPVHDGDGRTWAMYRLTASEDADHLENLFVLPPRVPKVLTGDPVEEVALFRDEMANMVWAVERRVQDELGFPVDRYEAHRERQSTGERTRIDGDIGDAELVYRLMSDVPEHWIPFVPVRLAESSAIQLERRAILRIGSNGTETVEPKGRVLQPGRPLRVEEEEVSREGIVVERAYQHARWSDGSSHLWMGRRKRVGRGEGASGLRFDRADQPRKA